MTIKFEGPMFKYFGTKWGLAKRGAYPAPKHDIIIEPFAGSAGYSLVHWRPGTTVVLMENNKAIYDMWGFFLYDREAGNIIRRLPVNLPQGADIDEELGFRVPAAARELMVRWQRTGRNTCRTVSAWNGKPGMWNERTRERCAWQAEMLYRHAGDFMLRDWHDFEDWSPATWFFDPPYENFPKSLYGNESTGFPENLLLDKFKGQVIVCETPGEHYGLMFESVGTTPNGRRKRPSHEGMYYKENV